MNNDLTAVKGIKVGNAEIKDAGTGCTVILAEDGFTIGAEIRGGAPATRETALISSEAVVDKANAVFLTGGSAFGLDAAGGVMQYLSEEKIGFKTGGGIVPIVPSAAIYDLEYISSQKPDQSLAYQACKNANSKALKSASLGAAAGAVCGKINGMESASKTLLGHASHKNGDLIVAALAVVNAFFDITDLNNNILAGAKNKEGEFIDSQKYILNTPRVKLGFSRENTTLVVVATNAILNKNEANRISMMGHSGFSRSINGVHTMLDGDAVFTVGTNKVKADINQIGITAAEVVRRAIVSAAG
ncbi:P1 family peptidase [Halanaerobium hydrogeniformans]|uniref:Peptidase S58 DmpA n=1 Tax=Halanaerobium hydrogeniformans TaxID=656519 RepID=E4RKB5_HALHG|nr:P1 family peptidase [Halanaerobium hydrogeniformans]ADQ15628.1 peptidase S58 DmpA [Halanaerobium hydrogeniformans]